MGGKLVLAEVDSNGIKRSCKIATSFFNKMNTLELLNETFFNSFVEKNKLFLKQSCTINEHNAYEKNNSIFAPYDYGILIFDFKNKQVFSLNNFDAYLLFGENNVKSDYNVIGHNQQEDINIYHKDKIVKTVSIFEENEFFLKTPRMIHSCIKMNGKIFHNGKEVIYNEHDNYFSVAQNICNNYAEKDKDHEGFEFSKYSNMCIDLDGWNIVRGDKSKEYLINAFNFYQNILTPEEIEVWLKEMDN